MRHFLFEDKPYRINPKFKRKRNEQDSAVALAYLLRKLTPRTKYKSNGVVKKHRVDTRQKCVVKMQYSDSKEAHKVQLDEYLNREGTDINGNRAELYGTNLNEYRNNMVDLNFRIFLSPQSDRISLKNMTENFMQVLQQRMGVKLYWQAADHYNTAHPHSHILINGVDQNGNPVEIPRDIVRTFMREYARDICTSQIGHRTRDEIEFEKSKEPEARRYTRLDDSIKYLCGNNLFINNNQILHDRDRIFSRLENLRSMGLCNYADGVYNFDPQWEETLRANSRYNTYLSARSQLEYSEQSDLQVFSGNSGAITGKITKIFSPNDDTSNNYAVIVESIDGKAYFVPLLKSPVIHDGKIKIGALEGDLVTVRTYENQRGRVTPVIIKRNSGSVIREINQNNYTGHLAQEIKTPLKTMGSL